MSHFYVYALLNSLKEGPFKYKDISFDFEPFYIGKGQTYRYQSHFNETLQNTRNKFKIYKIKKIQKQHKKVIVIKVFSGLTNEEAIKKEMCLISLIGRRNLNKGPLTNLTNGGEGMVGYKHSSYSKNLIRESNKRRGVSEKTKKRISKGVQKSNFHPDLKMRLAQSKKVRGKNNYFFGRKFVGIQNHNYGKPLSLSHKRLLSKLAKEKVGEKNPNHKNRYCVYNFKTKEEFHNIFNLTSVIKTSRRPARSIKRFKNWIILKSSKNNKKCSCSILREHITIRDLPINRYEPIIHYEKK